MTGKVGWLGIAFLTLFIFASFYIQLTGGPSRTQNARLDPYGDISVHLEPSPIHPRLAGFR